jgi:uncharacterized RDD family membrane protein YckC
MHVFAPPPPAPGSGPASVPAALVGRRLLALLYDALPVLALWMLAAVPFVLADVAISGDAHHNIGAFSTAQWLLWATCWLLTGAYAVLSWRRGGQTLGMRPWRLRVVAAGGGPAATRALCLRFLVGTASLLFGGLGFWWAWVDRERLAWHDRASHTRMVRVEKSPRT